MFPVLIGFTLFGFNGVLALAAVAGAAAVGAYLLRKDTAVEERRFEVLEASQHLSNEGFELLPPFLNRYGVGDYSGMVTEAKKITSVLRSPEQRQAVLQKFLRTQLEKAMKDPERRALVIAAVEDYKSAEKVRQDELFTRMQAERAQEATAKPTA